MIFTGGPRPDPGPYDFEKQFSHLLEIKHLADAFELLIITRKYLDSIEHLIPDSDLSHSAQCRRVVELLMLFSEMKFPEDVRTKFFTYSLNEFATVEQAYKFMDVNWLIMAANLAVKKDEVATVLQWCDRCNDLAVRVDVDAIREKLGKTANG